MCISPSRPRRGQIFITQTHTKQNDLSEVAPYKKTRQQPAQLPSLLFSIIDIVQGRALDLLRRRQEPTSSKELILHAKHYFTAPYKHKCSASANFISTKCSVCANFILQKCSASAIFVLTKCSASANFYRFYTTSLRSLLSDGISINIRPR